MLAGFSNLPSAQHLAKRKTPGEPDLPPVITGSLPEPAGQAAPAQAGGLWDAIMNPMTIAGLSILGSPTRDVGQGLHAGMTAQQQLLHRLDPNRELERRYKEAQIAKMQRDATGAGNKFGKTGAVFQGPDGNFYTMQFAEDGTRKIEPVQYPGQDGANPIPLSPARGVMEVGDTLVDKSTGGVVRNVGDNLFEGKRQEKLGEAQAAGQIALPKAERALRSYEIKSENVNHMIDTALQQASAWTTGFIGSVAGRIPGTPAYDLSKTLTGIKSNLGFETLQDMRDNSPTGGALGQVSNIELELLQSAWGSVEQSQSDQQLRENLNNIKQIKAQFVEAKRRAYQDDVARFGAQNVPNPETGQPSSGPAQGQPRVRTYNPQTGRLE